MKAFPFALLLFSLVGVAFTSVPAGAQTSPAKTNDAYTLDLLRRTIEEQQKNPGKVVPTMTNLPTAAAVTNVPPAPAGPTVSPEIVELERQYRAGKLSEKQYRKAVEQAQKKAANKPAATVAMSPKAAAAAGVKVAAPEPAIVTPPPPPNPNLKKLSDVDLQIQEMMRRKMEREKAAAAAAAAATNNPSGGPLTKRQRLDALLRQVVEGKMTDEEYKVAREKIAVEPD